MKHLTSDPPVELPEESQEIIDRFWESTRQVMENLVEIERMDNEDSDL